LQAGRKKKPRPAFKKEGEVTYFRNKESPAVSSSKRTEKKKTDKPEGGVREIAKGHS